LEELSCVAIFALFVLLIYLLFRDDHHTTKPA